MTERSIADEIASGAAGASPRNFHIPANLTSLAGPGAILRIAIVLFILVQVIAVGLNFVVADLLTRFNNGDYTSEQELSDQAATLEASANYLFWGSIGILVLNIIAYLVFVFVAARNIQRANARGMTHSTGGTIGWSFVPFANFFKIYQIFGEIWQASNDPVRGAYPKPIFMPFWWILYIVGNIVGRFAQRAMDSEGSLESLISMMWVESASSVMSFVSAILLFIMVSGIIRAQKAWPEIAARQQAAPPPPVNSVLGF